MASMCHFWRLSPDEFWDLDVDDYRALARYQHRYIEEQERASKSASARHRRR